MPPFSLSLPLSIHTYIYIYVNTFVTKTNMFIAVERKRKKKTINNKRFLDGVRQTAPAVHRPPRTLLVIPSQFSDSCRQTLSGGTRQNININVPAPGYYDKYANREFPTRIKSYTGNGRRRANGPGAVTPGMRDRARRGLRFAISNSRRFGSCKSRTVMRFQWIVSGGTCRNGYRYFDEKKKRGKKKGKKGKKDSIEPGPKLSRLAKLQAFFFF